MDLDTVKETIKVFKQELEAKMQEQELVLDDGFQIEDIPKLMQVWTDVAKESVKMFNLTKENPELAIGLGVTFFKMLLQAFKIPLAMPKGIFGTIKSALGLYKYWKIIKKFLKE